MGNKNSNNNEEEEEKTTKKNISKSNKNNKYKCKFHYSLYQNDCINSIDIIDDKIVLGTIMGDVSLIRVDENNLIVKKRDKTIDTSESNSNQEDTSSINSQENSNININSDYNNAKTVNKKDKGIKCIELNNTNHQIYLDNTNANPSEIIEEKKMQIKK